MSSFAVDVNKWAGKALKDFDRLRRAVIFELFSSVILDTPVLEGRLRGNWQVSSSGAPSGTVEFVKTSTGAESKSSKEIKNPRGPVSISGVKAVERLALEGKPTVDQAVYMSNNLPYAYTIEYDGWSHTKAPEGMVIKNFIRISQNLKKFNG